MYGVLRDSGFFRRLIVPCSNPKDLRLFSSFQAQLLTHSSPPKLDYLSDPVVTH